MSGRKSCSAIERFEEKFIGDPNSGCWLWTANVDRLGYGRFQWLARNTLAHRSSYELYIGKIPPGLLVLHKCDTPPCVRPDHLFLGTDADNMADRAAKGRTCRGEKKPRAKLKDGDVIAIRASTESGREIAARFGINEGTVSHIRARKRWAHL